MSQNLASKKAAHMKNVSVDALYAVLTRHTCFCMQRFAGWGTKSNVSLAHPPNQSSPNSEAKRVTAPWDTEQRPRAQGLG